LTFVQPTAPALQTGTPFVPNVFATPPNANQPIIVEPSPSLTAGVTEVWIFVTGGAGWGGANIHVSTDGSSYKYIGTIYSGGRQGVLTVPLRAFTGTNPDPLPDLVGLDLTESLGSLTSASASDAANAVSLCYCDGEFFSYETATLLAPYMYNLTTLYRGLYGTKANAHSAGVQFAYFGLQNDVLGLFSYQYPVSLIGTTISIKLQSFNPYLNMTQPIEDVLAYEYTLNGNGSVSPTNVPFSFNGVPQSGVPVLNYTFGAGDTFPANLAGSVCTSGVAATLSTTFNLSKNGSNYATMVFGASASSATFLGPSEMFIAGDILAITPARTDATLANLTGNLAGVS
jgi:hypothetical protein